MKDERPLKLSLTVSLTIALAAAVLCWADTGFVSDAEPGSEVGNPEEVPALTQATDVPVVEPWRCETDPFRRCARKAVAGVFGKIAPWQLVAYKRGLDAGITCKGFAYLTSYGDRWERESPWSAKGDRLDVTMCAADRGLPYNSVVWADGELRVKRDCGGAVTVRNAKRRGHSRNSRNLDFYTLRRDEHFSLSTRYAIVCTASECGWAQRNEEADADAE